MDYCMIMLTTSSKEEAEKITALLLENRAVSCMQMMPINSHYHWKGKIEHSNEILLLCKTTDALYTFAESLIRKNHSYEVPQIIKIPITGGLPEYLNWISQETNKQ